MQIAYYLNPKGVVVRVSIDQKALQESAVNKADLDRLAKHNGHGKPETPGWYDLYGAFTSKPFGYDI